MGQDSARTTSDPVTGSDIGNDFLRPFRGYGDINMVTWGGTSNYNSLQVQANRRYTRGFQYGWLIPIRSRLIMPTMTRRMCYFGRPFKAFQLCAV